MITIPKIIRPVPLADYAPELGAAAVWVWVNPPSSRLAQFYEARRVADALRPALARAIETQDADTFGRVRQELHQVGLEMGGVLSELWSQHSDAATHLSVQAVLDLAVSDTDPGLYPWLLERSLALITAHQDRSKKK